MKAAVDRVGVVRVGAEMGAVELEAEMAEAVKVAVEMVAARAVARGVVAPGVVGLAAGLEEVEMGERATTGVERGVVVKAEGEEAVAKALVEAMRRTTT